MTTLTLLHKISLIPTVAAEVLTAVTLLTILNAAANLLRGLWIALQILWSVLKELILLTLYLTTTYIIPALLFLADKISEVNSHIDWQQVRDDFLRDSSVIIAAVVAAVQVSWVWISTNIPAAYYWYEQRFIDVPQSAPVASVSVIKPLRDAKGRFVSTKRTVRRHGRLIAA